MEDDMISRKVAIEEIRTYITKPNISDDESEIKGYNDGLELAISVLSVLPSAQPIMQGWVCPVCGRGLSPFASVCPCKSGKGWEITCQQTI